MSIFFKARGVNSIGLLIVRLVLGFYTLSLGIMQASNVQLYINKIKSTGMLSENLAFIFGFIMPFVLIVFGALYIMGFFTPATSFILAATSLAKILVRGIFPTEGIPINKDLIFFACFLLTLFAGAGVISFDALLDKKKKTVAVSSAKTGVVTAEVVSETPKAVVPTAENPPAS
jgi:uncharacterized membrane protein YphA (DoxX/SURF4 family)